MKKQQQSPEKQGAESADCGGSVADQRAARRRQKQNQAMQLSAANVEESPRMDRGSEGGAGESMPRGRDASPPGPQAGQVDEQYGTKSVSKAPAPRRPSSGGSGSSQSAEAPRQVPNPGSSEESSGTERDTMTTSRPRS